MPENGSPHGEVDLKSQILEALSSLTQREAEVLKLAFGLENGTEVSREEIGRRLHLSPRRIREIEAVALRKLRHPGSSLTVKPSPIDAKTVQVPFTLIVQPAGPIELEAESVTDLLQLPSSPDLLLMTKRVSGNLASYFVKHPEEMKTMNRRLFEELIAELFEGFGYEVELTKQTRDGGYDIVAVRDAEVSVKYLIQAKRPEPTNPIGVQAVRELLGVKQIQGATQAILATTTYFTNDARLESQKVKWDLDLKDYQGILDWIEQYKRMKTE